jgi:hypothetical protein
MRLWGAMLFCWVLHGCGVYSPYGAQTSGAQTFSVAPFDMITPLATASSALALTEELRDRIQRQSTLRLVDADGELKFSGEVVTWEISPVNVQVDETAASNRLTIGLRIQYENTRDAELSFERTFTRFADYNSELDLISIEDALVEDIAGQLSQDIFNATLGNW